VPLSGEKSNQMTQSRTISNDIELFRPVLRRFIPVCWLLIVGIFLIHAFIRFGGIWYTLLIPLSMIVIWPIPWLLSTREARKAIGFKAPVSKRWFFLGPLYAMMALAVCAGMVWLIFGNRTDNWMILHALYLHDVLSQAPANASVLTLFALATLPALILSPFAEEFLFRGYMISGFSKVWGVRAAMCIQALAFALVHLAHYGLNPYQPSLVAVWLPSMFFVSMVLGWIVLKSGSIWVTVLSHGIFNLGMNGLVFLILPDLIGV
jgi:uncharacterized protein